MKAAVCGISSGSLLVAKVLVCSYPVRKGLWLQQGSHRLEKYLNIQDCLEKSLKIKFALKSTGKPLKSLEKSLNSTFFCRT